MNKLCPNCYSKYYIILKARDDDLNIISEYFSCSCYKYDNVKKLINNNLLNKIKRLLYVLVQKIK